MHLPKRCHIVISFWRKKKKEEGNGGWQQWDLRLEDKWSRGKRKGADGEREGMNLFMESRGERSLKFLSEENFIMTDNRGRDEWIQHVSGCNETISATMCVLVETCPDWSDKGPPVTWKHFWEDKYTNTPQISASFHPLCLQLTCCTRAHRWGVRLTRPK